jgi:hypothetical protein
MRLYRGLDDDVSEDLHAKMMGAHLFTLFVDMGSVTQGMGSMRWFPAFDGDQNISKNDGFRHSRLYGLQRTMQSPDKVS